MVFTHVIVCRFYLECRFLTRFLKVNVFSIICFESSLCHRVRGSVWGEWFLIVAVLFEHLFQKCPAQAPFIVFWNVFFELSFGFLFQMCISDKCLRNLSRCGLRFWTLLSGTSRLTKKVSEVSFGSFLSLPSEIDFVSWCCENMLHKDGQQWALSSRQLFLVAKKRN